MAASLSGALLATAHASAEAPRSFSLNVVRQAGAESCISSQRLGGLIERWIGAVFVRSPEGQFAIEVSLSPAPDGAFRARVTVNDASGAVLGVRELEIATGQCHALDRALVLMIVLAIDPEFAARGLPDDLLQALSDVDDPGADLLRQLEAEPAARSPARDVLEEEQAEPASAPDLPPADARGEPAAIAPPPRRWALEVEIGFGSDVGQLPRVATGPLLSLGIVPPGFLPLVLSVGLSLESDAALPAPSQGRAVHFTAQYGALEACPTLWAERPLQLAACAGLGLLARRADSRVLEEGGVARRLSLSARFGPRLSLMFGDRWSLGLKVTAAPAFGRDTYRYRDEFGQSRTLFRPPPIAVGAEAGFAFRM